LSWQVIEDVVQNPRTLLQTALDEVAWTEQMRSRQTASMGLPYNYSGASYPRTDWHPAVADLRDHIAPIIGFHATNCLLNHYPTGRHSLGWHSDDVDILAPGTSIAIVSLGATRPLGLRRSTADGFEYRSVLLPAGSLLLMSSAMQAIWRHRLPRDPTTEPRVSLTFRHIVSVVSESDRRTATGRSPEW
jgi:alkylated DNA repair dioxygenase AlkB